MKGTFHPVQTYDHIANTIHHPKIKAYSLTRHTVVDAIINRRIIEGKDGLCDVKIFNSLRNYTTRA